MTQDVAAWLYIAGLALPPAAVVVGLLLLAIPKAHAKGGRAAAARTAVAA
jgi:hypothetical protein